MRTRRSMLQAVLSAGATAALAGCGFQPVYMRTASGEDGPAERGLQAVNVGIIPDRPGQLLRQALQARFNNSPAAVAPRFDLSVNYYIAAEGMAVAPDDTSTWIRFTGRASWSLTSAAPARATVTSGTARAFDGMNVFHNQYFASDLETEQIQRRMAQAVASEIAMQLAVWFRRHPDQA